jgi:hypothetical protein
LGWITSDEARRYSELGIDHPQTQSFLKQHGMLGDSYGKALEIKGKELDNQQKAREVVDKQEKQDQENALSNVLTLTDPSQIPGFIAGLKPGAQKLFGKLGGITDLNQLQTLVMGAVHPEYSEARQRQEVERSRQQGLAAEQLRQNVDKPLVDKLTANPQTLPEEWAKLDDATQKRILPQLYARGFTSPGKPLSEKEIDTLQQQGSAQSLLTQMRQGITDNKNLFGWWEGLKANVPWDVEHKNAQAVLKLGDQVIGKMLEGGVLRKEDETKYREMLPQLTDPYDVATHKMDLFERNIQEQYQRYRQTLKATGRQLPETVITPKPPAGTKPSYQTIERIEAGTTPPQRIEPGTVKPSERTATGATVVAPLGSTRAEFVKDGQRQEIWIGPDGKYYDLPPEPILAPGKSAPLKTAPSIGTIEDGYVFLGGDPSQPSSWKKTKR